MTQLAVSLSCVTWIVLFTYFMVFGLISTRIYSFFDLSVIIICVINIIIIILLSVSSFFDGWVGGVRRL